MSFSPAVGCPVEGRDLLVVGCDAATCDHVRAGVAAAGHRVTVAGDATSGLFVLVTGAVAVAVGVYSPGYFGHSENSRVPLATMFGYATDLRSMTQGRASYSMELSHYAEVPASVAAELVAKSRA